MPSVRPPMHGRDHRPGGADPIPVQLFLGPAPLMGQMLPRLQLPNGFGTGGGVLWIPSREGERGTGLSLIGTGGLAADRVEVSFSHADPHDDHFDTVFARIHPIPDVEDDLTLSFYSPSDPWESNPWAGGGDFGYPESAVGATLTFSAPGGDWGGDNELDWVGFMAISEDDGDTVTWTGPGGWSEASPYTYDITGLGSIHYVFHKFNSGSTTDVVATFASGTSIKSAGYISIMKAAGVTPSISADIGESEATSTQRANILVDTDVPLSSGVLVVSAWAGPEGYRPSDATARPDVEHWTARASSNKVPLYKLGDRNYPVVRYIGGLGSVGAAAGTVSEIDGGAP